MCVHLFRRPVGYPKTTDGAGENNGILGSFFMAGFPAAQKKDELPEN
jgi:hypothetical protein